MNYFAIILSSKCVLYIVCRSPRKKSNLTGNSFSTTLHMGLNTSLTRWKIWNLRSLLKMASISSSLRAQATSAMAKFSPTIFTSLLGHYGMIRVFSGRGIAGTRLPYLKSMLLYILSGLNCLVIVQLSLGYFFSDLDRLFQQDYV